MTKTQVTWDFIQSSTEGELYPMEKKHTSRILMLMIGLFAGRLVSLHEMEVAELTGLSILIVCHGSEIWDGIQQFATRPAVRVYASPRAAQVQGLVLSFSLLKKLAFVAGIAFGGLMLILDAMHRHP